MKQKLKEHKGITLIALIITIVVLLILAVVAIKEVTGNGIISKAQEAARKTEKAKLNEELNTIIMEMNLDVAVHESEYKKSSSDAELLLENALLNIEQHFEVENQYIAEETITENGGVERTVRYINIEALSFETNEDQNIMLFKIPCKYKKQDIQIIMELKSDDTNDLYEITSFALDNSTLSGIKIKQQGTTPTVTAGGNIKQVTSDGVPIPTGFYYVTGTKNTGVVISDNILDENNQEGNAGNQFVWVPVETSPKLNVKVDSEKDIKTVRILNLKTSDGTAEETIDETINVNSDYFEKNIDLNDNCFYEVIATYKDGSVDDEIYIVNNVYKPLEEVTTMFKSLAELSGKSLDEMVELYKQDYLEKHPDAVFNTKLSVFKAVITEGGNDIINITEDNALETNSVLAYGGFYIGRYEVGIDGTITKNNTPKNNISFADAQTAANTMYNDNTKYGVKSNLLSAAAWERTLQWFVNSGATSYSEAFIQSMGRGNFRTNLTNGTGRLKNSGSSETYKINNIYDLAGNVQEWTTQIDKKEPGNVARGSDYNTYYTTASAYGTSTVTEANAQTGYRPILYFINK